MNTFGCTCRWSNQPEPVTWCPYHATLRQQLEQAEAARPVCACCGKPAVCFGEYETCDGKPDYACDACCGHGNEDGWCVMLCAIPEKWAKGEVFFANTEEALTARAEVAEAANARLSNIAVEIRAESAEAALAAMTKDFERECADADRVLIALGFSVETGRTEGGSLHLGRILARCSDLEQIETRLMLSEAQVAALEGRVSSAVVFCEDERNGEEVVSRSRVLAILKGETL